MIGSSTPAGATISRIKLGKAVQTLRAVLDESTKSANRLWPAAPSNGSSFAPIGQSNRHYKTRTCALGRWQTELIAFNGRQGRLRSEIEMSNVAERPFASPTYDILQSWKQRNVHVKQKRPEVLDRTRAKDAERTHAGADGQRGACLCLRHKPIVHVQVKAADGRFASASPITAAKRATFAGSSMIHCRSGDKPALSSTSDSNIHFSGQRASLWENGSPRCTPKQGIVPRPGSCRRS
uniref:Uncharacterized protein n=1 Tax=Trichuris muris TaxID=70415 RepID=A0A5S6QV52_TRIMR